MSKYYFKKKGALFGGHAMLCDHISVNSMLATLVGLEESIILRDIQTKLEYSDLELKNRKWVEIDTKRLRQGFPFWTIAKIEEILQSLETQNLLVKATIDGLVLYRIDKERFEKYFKEEAEEIEERKSNNA